VVGDYHAKPGERVVVRPPGGGSASPSRSGGRARPGWSGTGRPCSRPEADWTTPMRRTAPPTTAATGTTPSTSTGTRRSKARRLSARNPPARGRSRRPVRRAPPRGRRLHAGGRVGAVRDRQAL